MPLKIKIGARYLKWLHVDKHCAATGVLQSPLKCAKDIKELEACNICLTESLRTIYRDRTCRRPSKELSLLNKERPT